MYQYLYLYIYIFYTLCDTQWWFLTFYTHIIVGTYSGAVAKRGVGTALVSEALNVASKHGIDTVQCMALSLYTQKMCQKFSFEEFNR